MSRRLAAWAKQHPALAVFGTVIVLSGIVRVIGGPPTPDGTSTASPTNITAGRPLPAETRQGPTSTPYESSRVAPTTLHGRPASKPTATTTQSPAPKPPAAAPQAVDLTFSGGTNGHATQVVGLLPVMASADYSYELPEWSTQCVMPARYGAWEATTTVRLNGIGWQITITSPTLGGLPAPGRHPAINTDANHDAPDAAVEVGVSSDANPEGPSNGAAYHYYLTDAGNGYGTVTINPDRTRALSTSDQLRPP